MKTACLFSTGRTIPDACSLSWRAAFGEGLKRRGWRAVFTDRPKACDLLVIWGTVRQDVITDQLARGGEVVVLERGYLGDRFAWTSVSFGGRLNNCAEFRGPHEDGRRFSDHFAHFMQPWRETNPGYALVMQQMPGDKAVRGLDLQAFYAGVVAYYEPFMPVKVRPHPGINARSVARDRETSAASLAADLAGAHVAITWNSNSGVDAVLAGVPTIAMDCGSMAWPVAGHQLGRLVKPDRTAWANRLAWCQFTKEEMETGFCQEMVGL